MKKVAAQLLVLGFVSSSAFGGVVRFEQTSPDPYNDSGLGDTTATYEVWLDSSELFPAGFTAVDAIMGSNDGLILTDFAMNTAPYVFSAVDVPAVPPVYQSDIKAGGFAVAKVGLPLLLGTLTIDAAGLPDTIGRDPYTIMVDATIDGDRSKLANSGDPGVIDPLMGIGSVNVLPEPATLSLLALASLAFIRRRKVA